MKLLEPFYRLIGERKQSVEGCPTEAQILTYVRSEAAPPTRRFMERHMAYCDRCRETAASCLNSSADDLHEALPNQTTNGDLRNQVARIFGYIEADDRRQASQPEALKLSPQPSPKPAGGLYLSYSQLVAAGVVCCAVLVFGAIFYLTRGESASQIADAAIAKAMREERRILARVSGDVPWARYKELRGEGDGYEAQLNRARERLSENIETDPDAKMALARLYLVSGKKPDTTRAFDVLKQLEEGGMESAEFLNDMGVANYMLGFNAEAISYFSRALEKSPGFTQALFNRALAHENAGKREEALKDWERFLAETSDENWKQEARERIDRSKGAH
jgi:tetratricopeptide (TPR) repeat protein